MDTTEGADMTVLHTHFLSRYNGSRFVEIQNWTSYENCMDSIIFTPGNQFNNFTQSNDIYLLTVNSNNKTNKVFKFNNITLQFEKYINVTNIYDARRAAFLKFKNNRPKNSNGFMLLNGGAETKIYEWIQMLSKKIKHITIQTQSATIFYTYKHMRSQNNLKHIQTHTYIQTHQKN